MYAYGVHKTRPPSRSILMIPYKKWLYFWDYNVPSTDDHLFCHIKRWNIVFIAYSDQSEHRHLEYLAVRFCCPTNDNTDSDSDSDAVVDTFSKYKRASTLVDDDLFFYFSQPKFEFIWILNWKRVSCWLWRLRNLVIRMEFWIFNLTHSHNIICLNIIFGKHFIFIELWPNSHLHTRRLCSTSYSVVPTHILLTKPTYVITCTFHFVVRNSFTFVRMHVCRVERAVFIYYT